MKCGNCPHYKGGYQYNACAVTESEYFHIQDGCGLVDDYGNINYNDPFFKEETMRVHKKEPVEAATSQDSREIVQAQDNTALKPNQVSVEILRELAAMRKRYLEIYRNGYRVCGIDSSNGVHLAEVAFLDTFSEYNEEPHGGDEFDTMLVAEFEGQRYFTLKETNHV